MARSALASATAILTLLHRIAAAPAASGAHKTRCGSAHRAQRAAQRNAQLPPVPLRRRATRTGAAPRQARPPAVLHAPAAAAAPTRQLQPTAHERRAGARRRPCAWSTANAPRTASARCTGTSTSSESAQAHTESMAFGDYFEHIGPSGETPLSRMRRDGYIYSSHLGFEVGENIGWGSLWLGTPRARSSPPGWPRRVTARTSSTRRFRDTGIGVSPHADALAHGQAGGDLHAGLRRPVGYRARAVSRSRLRALRAGRLIVSRLRHRGQVAGAGASWRLRSDRCRRLG